MGPMGPCGPCGMPSGCPGGCPQSQASYAEQKPAVFQLPVESSLVGARRLGSTTRWRPTTDTGSFMFISGSDQTDPGRFCMCGFVLAAFLPMRGCVGPAMGVMPGPTIDTFVEAGMCQSSFDRAGRMFSFRCPQKSSRFSAGSRTSSSVATRVHCFLDAETSAD